jgi:hypothetical protein
MEFSINDILECGSYSKNITAAEYMKTRYEAIGQYIVDHAEELTKGVTDNVAILKIEISIEPNSVITLKNEINYYVTKSKANKDGRQSK